MVSKNTKQKISGEELRKLKTAIQKKLNDIDFVKNVGNSNKDYIKNLLNEEQLYEDLKKILS